MRSESSSKKEEIRQNQLVFILNQEEKTAGVISNDDATGDIIIPRSINHEAEEYIITSILRNSFKNSKTVQSIQMPPDSELRIIEKESFSFSTLQSICIPSSVTELKDGWCCNTPQLTKITLVPNNSNYIYLDDTMLIGKTDKKSDKYDNLIFVRRDIQKVAIPSFIKQIGPYSFSQTKIESITIPLHITRICEGAFYRCTSLKRVEIPANSKLQTIENYAFSESSIEIISIPSTVIELKEKWCQNSPNLTRIEILKGNQSNNNDDENSKQSILVKKLLDIIQCPNCYYVMVAPFRCPMIIPECGHTICELCLSRVNECPLCHQPFKKPIKNMHTIQFINAITHSISIPSELSPPAPFVNKLLLKIEPICTFAVTDTRKIRQNLYQCKTCNHVEQLDMPVFCEICAQKCHEGHKIFIDEDCNVSFCNCTHLCDCKCLPKDLDNLRCTFDMTYGVKVKQPMYECNDCHISNPYAICQNCAIKCHKGHDLRYIGIVSDKLCHCLDQSFCKISNRRPVCTCYKNSIIYIPQKIYHCKTCQLTEDSGCCAACAYNCHRGHDVSFHMFHNRFYCDCGASFKGVNCTILKNLESGSYLNTCPNLSFENKYKKILQRKYYCSTCGISGSLGICEGCAINCHINHSIKFVGMDEFICTCQSTENCIMSLGPLLHNDRKICDRKVLQRDDYSACYTCYTCDKSGQITICETCALKDHIDHDIHLVGYMKFNCMNIIQ